ncbi:hypothetical protein CAEBREN_03901 [Caenorhabditis brenneri]|uniref:Uncharacterized protein n=1 Tax=Caenorhabditis brenneri TaxID=135651 RepID=G0N3N3_CAEBE|nr:hypothetical protein CAEBREN_03901 [Caenorhabditis brenneri]
MYRDTLTKKSTYRYTWKKIFF